MINQWSKCSIHRWPGVHCAILERTRPRIRIRSIKWLIINYNNYNIYIIQNNMIWNNITMYIYIHMYISIYIYTHNSTGNYVYYILYYIYTHIVNSSSLIFCSEWFGEKTPWDLGRSQRRHVDNPFCRVSTTQLEMLRSAHLGSQWKWPSQEQILTPPGLS